MIIDSHCHLNYEPMSLSLKETIERANNDGVKYLLTISTEDKSFDKILKIIQEFKCVYGTYGIHPHEAKNHDQIKVDDIIEKVKTDKKIIGIGESGLDFYYNHSEKNDQIKCFEEHITAAQELQIPIVVHTRSAEKETLEIIKKKKVNPLIMNLEGNDIVDIIKTNPDIVNIFVKKYYDALSKVDKDNLANTFKEIPADRILVETDAPYLAPVPLRGKPNEPSYIIHTVKFLSKIKELSYEDLSNTTSKNFFNLFGKLE